MNSTQRELAAASHTPVARYCISTKSGLYVDLADPTKRDIELSDIEHALSHINRFTGHAGSYSVAEHSGMAAMLASIDGCTRPQIAAVLMHDAAEAYIGDISSPLKALLESYGVDLIRNLEAMWLEVIGQKFDIDFVSNHELIKKYDMQLLKFEKSLFWPGDNRMWTCLDGVEDRRELPNLYPIATSLFGVMAKGLGW